MRWGSGSIRPDRVIIRWVWERRRLDLSWMGVRVVRWLKLEAGCLSPGKVFLERNSLIFETFWASYASSWFHSCFETFHQDRPFLLKSTLRRSRINSCIATQTWSLKHHWVLKKQSLRVCIADPLWAFGWSSLLATISTLRKTPLKFENGCFVPIWNSIQDFGVCGRAQMFWEDLSLLKRRHFPHWELHYS